MFAIHLASWIAYAWTKHRVDWHGPRLLSRPNWPLEFGGWTNVLAIVLIPLRRLPDRRPMHGRA
jgi:hypothetical protein